MYRNVSDWSGQYVISQRELDITSFKHESFHDLNVYVHNSLPLVKVYCDDKEIALVLGWVVSHSGELLDQIFVSSKDDVVEHVNQFGGRWLLLTSDCIYVDSTASQPAVFSKKERIIASSPELIKGDYDNELIADLNVVEKDNWYPFGLTPKVGVNRLTPNHHLCLNDFVSIRNEVNLNDANVSLENLIDKTINSIDSTGAAFINSGLFVGLTAGFDSRMLLAGLKEQIKSTNNVKFWTAKSVALDNPKDIYTAKKLSMKFSLNHDVIYPVSTSQGEIDSWLMRVGHVRAGAKMFNHKMEEEAGGNKPFFHGMIGELARGTYWKDGDSKDKLNGKFLLQRMNLPQTPKLISAANIWLENLPNDISVYKVLDLLYLEQRIGCWGSAANIASTRHAPIVFPLNRKDVVDGMLNLSVAEKKSESLHKGVIKRQWPELLYYPFNETFGSFRLYWPVWYLVRKMKQRVLRKLKLIKHY